MSPLAPDRLAEFDAFLIELNRASGQAILPLFRGDHGLVNKLGPSGFDPVTEADRGAERAIRALIAQRYPDHCVIGHIHVYAVGIACNRIQAAFQLNE